jgi:UDP-glucose 4-epimerase
MQTASGRRSAGSSASQAGISGFIKKSAERRALDRFLGENEIDSVIHFAAEAVGESVARR